MQIKKCEGKTKGRVNAYAVADVALVVFVVSHELGSTFNVAPPTSASCSTPPFPLPASFFQVD